MKVKILERLKNRIRQEPILVTSVVLEYLEEELDALRYQIAREVLNEYDTLHSGFYDSNRHAHIYAWLDQQEEK